MPVYFPSFRWLLIPACPEGSLRLSRPGCLVLRPGCLPIQRRSPTQALTGPSVEELRWSSPTCYHYTKSATRSIVIWVLCTVWAWHAHKNALCQPTISYTITTTCTVTLTEANTAGGGCQQRDSRTWCSYSTVNTNLNCVSKKCTKFDRQATAQCTL